MNHLKRLKELTEELVDRDFMLKKKQTMLESLLDSSPIPVLIWITDLSLTFVDNEDLGKLSSIGIDDPSEFIGTTVYEYFNTTDPESEPIKYLLRVLEGETVTYWINIEERNLYSKCSPVTDYDGNIVGIIGITWDLGACTGKIKCK